MPAINSAKTLDKPFEIVSDAQLGSALREAARGWKFAQHPLRERKQEKVNELYVRGLEKLGAKKNFDEGKIEFLSSNDTDGTWMCGLRRLTWDSDFFGFNIGRIEPFFHPERSILTHELMAAASDCVRNAVKRAAEHGLVHVTAAADPADTLSIYALEANGFRLKDTMMYHFFDTTTLSLTREDVTARVGTMDDSSYLEDLTWRCFGNRDYIVNRFNSDPRYPLERVKDMYKIWIKKSLTGERADIVLVVDVGGKPAGYLTGILPTEEEISLGVDFGDMGIGAVDPDFQRQGVFRIVHKELLLWFKERNIRYVQTRTALSTSGVNKNCFRHGSSVPCSPHTFHLDIQSA